MALHKSKEFNTQWFSVSTNINLKFRTITIFRSIVQKKLKVIIVDTHTPTTSYCTSLQSAAVHKWAPKNKI
jgi:hypothetical protein